MEHYQVPVGVYGLEAIASDIKRHGHSTNKKNKNVHLIYSNLKNSNLSWGEKDKIK